MVSFFNFNDVQVANVLMSKRRISRKMMWVLKVVCGENGSQGTKRAQAK